jgi:hypothetical protein
MYFVDIIKKLFEKLFKKNAEIIEDTNIIEDEETIKVDFATSQKKTNEMDGYKKIQLMLNTANEKLFEKIQIKMNNKNKEIIYENEALKEEVKKLKEYIRDSNI